MTQHTQDAPKMHTSAHSEEGSSPKSSFCSSSSSYMAVFQQLGRISESSHFFAILRAFPHLPSASLGAITLITYCTHFYSQYNKMA